MTVQGTAAATATSVAIPTHQAGDLLMVFTRADSNTAPTKPTAAGTVPNWTVPQAAGANTVALSSAWFIATATNHTTGAWTGATHICVLVLRPDASKALTVATSSTGNANATQTIVYPALTLSTRVGTSWGVRCGTRGFATTNVGNAPTNWTQRIIQPPESGTTFMSVHTRASLTANPVADTVTTFGNSVGYRAHTLEVTETTVVVQSQKMVTIA